MARLNGFGFALIINTPFPFFLLLAAEAPGRIHRAFSTTPMSAGLRAFGMAEVNGTGRFGHNDWEHC
jgi:hypothetical protein